MPINLVLYVQKQANTLPQHTDTASDSDRDKSGLGDMSSLLLRLSLMHQPKHLRACQIAQTMEI